MGGYAPFSPQIIEREHAQHIAELLRIPMYEIQSSSHDELKKIIND